MKRTFKTHKGDEEVSLESNGGKWSWLNPLGFKFFDFLAAHWSIWDPIRYVSLCIMHIDNEEVLVVVCLLDTVAIESFQSSP